MRDAVARIGLDVQTLVVSSLPCLVGYQLVIFAVFTKVFAVTEQLHPISPTLGRLFEYVTLEVGLACGTLLCLAGLAAREGMPLVVPAALLFMLGMQTLFASSFLSILGLRCS
jgi:hypothetical protein